MGFYVEKRARGRGYGHGVIKNSLPLAPEVASGNLHLIPGGPLCQPAIRWLPARGKRGGKLGRGNARGLPSPCAVLPEPELALFVQRYDRRLDAEQKSLTPNYARHLTK